MDPEGAADGSRTPPDSRVARVANSALTETSPGDLQIPGDSSGNMSPRPEGEGVPGLMDPTDPSKLKKSEEQDNTVHADPPPDSADRRSDPAPALAPDLDPGIPSKPKPAIKRKKRQFGRRRKKRSRTREGERVARAGEGTAGAVDDAAAAGDGATDTDPGPGAPVRGLTGDPNGSIPGGQQPDDVAATISGRGPAGAGEGAARAGDDAAAAGDGAIDTDPVAPEVQDQGEQGQDPPPRPDVVSR